MKVGTRSIVLVIDDNAADIELLEAAWAEAGLSKSIIIQPCSSYEQALAWLRDGIPADSSITGILVDLMLFDAAGIMVVDKMSELPQLKGIPIISWSGISLGKVQTNRLKKSATRVWQKPGDWPGFAAFTRRFHNVITGRASSSSSRLSPA
jgi:CheY-like chemotaxis protein